MINISSDSRNAKSGFLADIARLCRIIENNSKASVTYRKGQEVFHEGTRPMGVYFIKRGKVKTTSAGPFGEEKIVGILNAFSFVGYQELMEGETYQCTATVIEQAEIYYISREKFLELVENESELLNRIMNVLRYEPVAV
ncbi:cyclic nucleotide-binding domain-containing protein [Cytophagaceae bacterium ABcell3]|nr:cyclic nucleotide-binding domain-containing protein [Cytophagaceae bacterium ABcell3]